MSGVVRSVMIRMAVDNSQAVRAPKEVAAAFEQAAGRVKSSGVDFEKLNESIAGFAGKAAVGGAAGLAVMERSVVNFDKAMSGIDAATHETTKNMGLLREAAIQAGADTSFSASDAAQGITELAKAGVSTKAVLAGGLKGALDLAAAGQIDVSEAAETAATAMTQFSLKGKDVTHIADLLAAGAGKAQGGVHDLAAALNQSGLVASQVGLSIEETTGALSAFASAGLIGSDAGTSFKTMLISLNPRSKEAAGLMKKLNIEAYDAQGNFVGIEKYAGKLRAGLKDLTGEQRASALQTIFGTDAIRAANILYRQGAGGIRKWIGNVNDQGYAADTAARQLDNLAGDVEKFTGSLETAFIKSGTGAQAGLRDIVQGAENLVNKFNELPSSVQLNVVKAVAGLTILSGAIYGVSKGISAVSSAAKILGLSKSGRRLAGAASSSVAGGVQKVFVTNWATGAAGAGAGAAGAGAGAGAGAAGAGAGAGAGAVSRFGLARMVLSRVAITAGSVVLAGQLARGITSLLNGALPQNAKNPSPLYKDFAKDGGGGPLGSIKSRNSLESTVNKVSALQGGGGFNGFGIRSNVNLGKLFGMGNVLKDDVERIKTLDKALAQLSFEDPSAAATEFQHVLKESGVSTKELNKVLPKTAAALKSVDGNAMTGAQAMAARNRGSAIATAQAAQYAKVLRSVPKQVRSYVSTPGSIRSISDMTRLAKQYKLTPKQVRTIMKLQGFSETQQRIAAAGASYRRLPKGVRTAISTPGAIKSEADVLKLQRRYALTPAQKKTVMQVSGVDAAIARVNALQREIAAVRSKSVTIETVIRRRQGGGTNLATPRADGGPVPGVGGPREDNILIAASAREFVHPVASVDHYGDAFMEAVRTRRLPKPVGYAGGGSVGRAGAGVAVTPSLARSGGSYVDLGRALTTALQGMHITGTLDGPFGPQQLEGVVVDLIAQNDNFKADLARAHR